MRHRLRVWITPIVAALVVAAGIGLVADATLSVASAKTVKHVQISNFTFTPKNLTVKKGTTVVWTNKDSIAHNVTSTNGLGINAKVTNAFGSANLNQGKTFSFTFKKKGTFFYECTIHRSMASMHAEVTVK